MTSFIRTQRGGHTRYDQDNRRVQRGALTYTTETFAGPTLIAGPITLTLQATADTTESLWVAHIDDVAPDGSSRPLTQGALLGSHRALDPERTWYLPDGTVLKPHHISTRAAVKPVIPGELTRYDVEIFPTAALLESGHQLRLTVTTFDFPHLVPTVPARRALAGGTLSGAPRGAHAVASVDPGGRTGQPRLTQCGSVIRARRPFVAHTRLDEFATAIHRRRDRDRPRRRIADPARSDASAGAAGAGQRCRGRVDRGMR